LVSGLVTVKYIYGASTTGGKSDDVVGSSLQGKLETGITMARLTTAKETDDSFGEVYEKKARDHNARHKGAKVELVDTLNRNGRRSFCALEKAINNWCSYKTIERFFKSQPDFDMYSQNVRPLLSEGNRQKQVAFSKHVRNRWGLGEGQKFCGL
jgi:hypothetical protein